MNSCAKKLTCFLKSVRMVSKKNKQFQGPIACIAPRLVRMLSHTTYQANLYLDPISLTLSIQTLESTIQIYHHKKWHSCCGNHTTALKIGNSQCKIRNLWDFPTQHKFLYVLDAHQHWISQWCCYNDICVSTMSQDNYGHPPTTIYSQIDYNKMVHHYFFQECKQEI